MRRTDHNSIRDKQMMQQEFAETSKWSAAWPHRDCSYQQLPGRGDAAGGLPDERPFHGEPGPAVGIPPHLVATRATRCPQPSASGLPAPTPPKQISVPTSIISKPTLSRLVMPSDITFLDTKDSHWRKHADNIAQPCPVGPERFKQRSGYHPTMS